MDARKLFATSILCVCVLGPVSSGASPRVKHALETHRGSRSIVVASGRHRVKRAPNTSAATWQMPWQIRPIVYAARGRRERILEALVPKTGRVRGTRTAIATIGMSLRPAPGPNRTVKACRAAVAREALRFGAREVEAVSAGREHVTTARRFVAPVKFRVTYKTRRAYEVRISILTCVVNRRSKLLNAYVSTLRSRRI